MFGADPPGPPAVAGSNPTRRWKKVHKTFKTQREAKRWVNDQQGAINNGTAVVPSNMTVSELMAYWLEHDVRYQWAGTTDASYESTESLLLGGQTA